MDIVNAAMARNLQAIQMTVNTAVLQKTMGRDAQAMAAIMDMMPAQQATYAGHMDIRV